MADNATVNIPNDILTPIIQAKVVEALGGHSAGGATPPSSTGATVDGGVALARKVDHQTTAVTDRQLLTAPHSAAARQKGICRTSSHID
jgi:hypothetical protein